MVRFNCLVRNSCIEHALISDYCAGGFWDHVPPPAGVPPPSSDMLPSYPDPDFYFDRLGVRIPTVLVSPWIQKVGAILLTPMECT